MSFKYLKNIVSGIKKLDQEVNDYKRIGQHTSLPNIAYVAWGIHLAESGEIDKAEEKLLSSTLMAQQTPEAYINLGVLKTKSKKYEEAIKLYEKALNLDCENAKAYCFLGNTYTEMQKYEEAEKNYEYAMKIEPFNPDILINSGICLVRQRKLLQAKEAFQKACKINPLNLFAIHYLGLVELELNETDASEEKFKFIISVDNTNFEALYYLAYIYYKKSNFEKSLSLALKSLEFFNKKTETYMLIAENYMNLKNEKECINYYELGAKETKPTYYYFISWGVSLQSFERYEESIEKFNQAIEKEDINDIGYAYLGISYYKLKNIEKAQELLEKASSINPKNTVALDGLGRINFDNKNYTEAIKCFEQGLKISAKAVENYRKIAKAYFSCGNFEKAKEYFNKAVEYQPDEPLVYIDYARLLIEKKEYELAIKKLQTVKKIMPDNSDYLNLLFYANFMLAKEHLCDYNVERAIQIARKIEEINPESFNYKQELKELEEKITSKNTNQSIEE